MSFPEQLKNARLACGLTQQEVAQALNIDKTTYSSYETGRRQPDVARLRQLARLLEVSGDQLLELAPRLGAAPTPEEMGQVKKYRLLDLHGRELVDLVLDKEYQRMARAPEKEEKGWITYINCYDLAVSAGTGTPVDSVVGGLSYALQYLAMCVLLILSLVKSGAWARDVMGG